MDIRAKPEYHKFLIGKGGGKIRKVRDSTGARIIFPAAEDKDQDLITIIGKEDAVREAQKELEALIQNLVGSGPWLLTLFMPWWGERWAIFHSLSQHRRIMWLKTTCWWTPNITAILSSEEVRSCGRLLKSMVGSWSASHALAHRVIKSPSKEPRTVWKQPRSAFRRSSRTW